jgi:hypothetical protein
MRNRNWLALVATATFALGLIGCNGAVATSKDDRSIIGQSAWFSSAKLRSSDHGTFVTLGGKTVTIAASEITWGEGRSLALPAQWRDLRLTESSGSILVTVDGEALARIWPKA